MIDANAILKILDILQWTLIPIPSLCQRIAQGGEKKTASSCVYSSHVVSEMQHITGCYDLNIYLGKQRRGRFSV